MAFAHADRKLAASRCGQWLLCFAFSGDSASEPSPVVTSLSSQSGGSRAASLGLSIRLRTWLGLGLG